MDSSDSSPAAQPSTATWRVALLAVAQTLVFAVWCLAGMLFSLKHGLAERPSD